MGITRVDIRNTVALAFVSAIITLPLFLSGSLILTQDILFHATWSEQFHRAFLEGVLYPRWVDTPFGYGSPVFLFYAPLSYYVISLINLAIKSHIQVINLAVFLSFFLSGLSMYFFAGRLNGERAGLVSGVFYQLIPYHVFDLFVRGVIPELFAFIWFPLILFFLRDIFIDKKWSSVVYMSLAYAGLIMTHLVSAFMFSYVMGGYGFYLFVVEKKKGVVRMFFSMVLGIGLSSIYLVPVFFERSFVHIEFITKFYNYKDSFLFLHRNLMEREFYHALHGIAIIEMAFLIFSLILLRRKFVAPKNAFFVLLLFVSLFLTTPLSSFVWKHVPEISNLQFPWRWLPLSGFSVALIAGELMGNSKGEIKKSVFIVSFPLIVISLFIMLQVSFFTSKEIDYWRVQSVLFSPIEYRPIWLKNHRKRLAPAERAEVTKGVGSADIIEWKSNQRVLSASAETSLSVRVSTFYYPGWEARIDGKEWDVIVEKDSGAMLIEVPKGRHKIELSFRDTPVRHYSKVSSAVSLFIIVFLVFFNRKNSQNSMTMKEIET